jgi:DNA polymerase III epsilon subunit-like protein
MTGLDPDFDEVIEIAAVRFEQRGSARRRESVCKLLESSTPSKPEARAIHRITDEERAAGEHPASALEAFLDFVGDRALVGHGTSLDLVFLSRAIARWLPHRAAPLFAIDTLTLARRAMRSQRYTLESLCSALGIHTSGLHRAEQDATATAALFERLAPMFAPRDARDLWEVRVGQHHEVRVRRAIASQIEQLVAEKKPARFVVRHGGAAPRALRAHIERWDAPHLRLHRASAAPTILRADRILRIESINAPSETT